LNSPERHKVRLAAKTLLYACEVLYSQRRSKRHFFKRLSHLLRELGATNDCATTRGLIAQLIEREKDMDGRFAAGIIAGWAAAEVKQEGDTLRKAWKRFRSAHRPWEK
jgi:CHAD domain-containing protein